MSDQFVEDQKECIGCYRMRAIATHADLHRVATVQFGQRMERELSRIHLRYYSTTRDKAQRDLKHGWLELKIVSPAGKLRIDSEVVGFAMILDAVAKVAEYRKIEVDETTAVNLKAFRCAALGTAAAGGDD